MPLVLLFGHVAAAAVPAPIGASSGLGTIAATGRGDATPTAEAAAAGLGAYATAEKPPAPAKTFPPVFAIPMRRRRAEAVPIFVGATSAVHDVVIRGRGAAIVRPIGVRSQLGDARAIGIEWLSDEELVALIYEAAA